MAKKKKYYEELLKDIDGLYNDEGDPPNGTTKTQAEIEADIDAEMAAEFKTRERNPRRQGRIDVRNRDNELDAENEYKTIQDIYFDEQEIPTEEREYENLPEEVDITSMSGKERRNFMYDYDKSLRTEASPTLDNLYQDNPSMNTERLQASPNVTIPEGAGQGNVSRNTARANAQANGQPTYYWEGQQLVINAGADPANDAPVMSTEESLAAFREVNPITETNQGGGGINQSTNTKPVGIPFSDFYEGPTEQPAGNDFRNRKTINKKRSTASSKKEKRYPYPTVKIDNGSVQQSIKKIEDFY